MDRHALILEARALIDQYFNQDTGMIDRTLIEKAKQQGWEAIGNGAYKQAIAKGPIVLKFAFTSPTYGKLEVEGEARQYRDGPEDFVGYLTPLYDNYKGALIQEKVEKCSHGCYCENELREVIQRFNLCDAWGNHGHLDGKLKFHDWVLELGRDWNAPSSQRS